MGEIRKEIGELKVELADIKAQLNLILQIVQAPTSRAAEVPLPASVRDHLPGGRPCTTLVELCQPKATFKRKSSAQDNTVPLKKMQNKETPQNK